MEEGWGKLEANLAGSGLWRAKTFPAPRRRFSGLEVLKSFRATKFFFSSPHFYIFFLVVGDVLCLVLSASFRDLRGISKAFYFNAPAVFLPLNRKRKFFVFYPFSIITYKVPVKNGAFIRQVSS